MKNTLEKKNCLVNKSSHPDDTVIRLHMSETENSNARDKDIMFSNQENFGIHR